jgi:hypothetical protein
MGRPKNSITAGRPWKKRIWKRGTGIIDTYGQRQRRAHEDRKMSTKGIEVKPHEPRWWVFVARFAVAGSSVDGIMDRYQICEIKMSSSAVGYSWKNFLKNVFLIDCTVGGPSVSVPKFQSNCNDCK